MKKDLPEMYHGEFKKDINNNRCIYSSMIDNKSNKETDVKKNVIKNDRFAIEQNGNKEKIVNSSSYLNDKILETSIETNTKVKYSTIHCSEAFYKENNQFREIYSEYGCVGCEMETFALFHIAKLLGKNAACILTCSDNLVTKEETTPQERQTSFTKMIELALNSSLKL